MRAVRLNQTVKFWVIKPKQWVKRCYKAFWSWVEPLSWVVNMCGFVATSNPLHFEVVMWSTVNIKIEIIATLNSSLQSHSLCLTSVFVFLIWTKASRSCTCCQWKPTLVQCFQPWFLVSKEALLQFVFRRKTKSLKKVVWALINFFFNLLPENK